MRKKNSSGLFINILILIISVLTATLFFIDYSRKRSMSVGGFATTETNTTISSIQGESLYEIDNIEQKSQEENVIENVLVLPIIEENPKLNVTKSNENNIYKYYYNQLDDNAKVIYKSIEDKIEDIKTGTYVIQLPNSVGNILNKENGEAILNREFQSAWDAIIMDRVELFYVDVSKVTLEIRTTSYGKAKTHKLSMKPNSENYLEKLFYNEQRVNYALNQLEKTKEQIVSQLSGSDYDKIVQVNDWLVDNIEYSTTYGESAYNIYGALIGRKCVCEGYAEAFKYMMDEINIPCIIVIGEAQNSEGNVENHEWNYVQLGEKWYAVDATWNDPIMVGGGKITQSIKHKYLLNGIDINSNHSPNGKISTNGIIFSYPTLSDNNYTP